MKQSQFITKTRKEDPKDEVSKNAKLLIRAGFIYKEMAGVYTLLPLGLRVMRKIEQIIREEMNELGGQEMQMTALQEKKKWELTNRWSSEEVDSWFKTELAHGDTLGLAFTHEEPLTNLLTEYVSSYKDLPFSAYQFQTKFRNEARAKSGIMRGREFLMKDLYSFSKDEAEFEAFYEKAKGAYTAIFNRVGLGKHTYITYADGGSFGEFSHEFQTITDAGEDIIYIDEQKNIAINKELYTDEMLEELDLDKNVLVEKKAVEVGNIFPLGTKFSKTLGLNYKTEKGDEVPVVMGAYGIGLGRLMGTVVEVFADERGIIWPESISPFDVHVVPLYGSDEDEAVRRQTDALVRELEEMGHEVLIDDREDVRPGEKFADSDLYGIPYRIVVSEKSIEAGGVEMKRRSESEARIIPMNECLSLLENMNKNV